MDNLDRWHAARKTQLAPQTLTLVERDMSRLLGVQDSELTRLLETTRAVNAEIRAIDGQMIDHANRRASLELAPVPATMQALQAKRRAALQAGLGRVQAALSATAWNGVTGYINSGLRDSITTVRPGGK